MKHYIIIKSLTLPLILVGMMLFAMPGNMQAQKISISTKVVDEDGNPIKNAIVRVFNKNKVINTDQEGMFNISVNTDDVVYISAQGYKTLKIKTDNYSQADHLVLKTKVPYIMPDELVQVPFYKLEKKRTVGAVSVVDGDELLSYPDLSLLNALSGKVAGLYSTQKSSTPGWNAPTLSIRGQGGSGNNTPLILVDGLERDANALLPEEIESIEVLKDISAKMLYGSRASNGVIIVTTKRGKYNSRDARVNVEYGIMAPTSDPKWLDAADYATLYNQARTNDGLPALYSNEAIAAYRNGSDPILYPNNDYQKEFLNSYMPMTRAATEFQGGGNTAAYYLNLGYTGTGGLEDVDEPTTYNKLNLRGNLDIKVTSVTSVKMDVAGRMEYRRSANMTTQDFFGALSSHRPNEYPIMIPSDSISYFGGSYLHPTNIYGMANETSYKKQEDRNIQFNVGLDFNLNKYIDGLSAGIYLSYDNESLYRYGVLDDYATYTAIPDDNEAGYSLIKLRNGKSSQLGKQSKIEDNYYHRVGTTTKLDYVKNIDGKHDIIANVLLQQYQTQRLNQIQYDRFANYGLRVNYMYDKKYVAEINSSIMGSSHFAKGNRFGMFPSLGLGWIMSEEDFLSNSSLIDYLKLKISGGVMGSDTGIGYYLYEDRYNQNGSVSFGLSNKSKSEVYQLSKYGNPDVTWEKSREFNIGFESILLNKSLSVEMNYFNILDYDIITTQGATNPDYIGSNLYSVNQGEVFNQGIEGDITYFYKKGDLSIDAGFNFVYSKSEIKETNQLNYPEELSHLSVIGNAKDDIYGYIANGYLTENDMANGYYSTLGAVKAGDIKYVDINNDGVIDSKDRKVIGNSTPRLSMGLHLNLSYKGIGLYALGVFNSGFDVMKNNKYYWMHSSRKYSVEAMKDYYPPLTTTNGTNNFTGSDFWLEDASFFKLKNVELSYTLPDQILPLLKMKKAKLFVRGTNLLSFSKFDDLDPENIDAGIADYPLMKAITGGISLTF